MSEWLAHRGPINAGKATKFPSASWAWKIQHLVRLGRASHSRNRFAAQEEINQIKNRSSTASQISRHITRRDRRNDFLLTRYGFTHGASEEAPKENEL